MKLDSDSIKKLKADIRARAKSRRYSEIAAAAQVDASQVSRICRGAFKTLSHNVVQVCMALGVETQTIKIEAPAEPALEQRLERSLLDVWDRTPADADRLVRFLNDLAALRRPSRRDT